MHKNQKIVTGIIDSINNSKSFLQISEVSESASALPNDHQFYAEDSLPSERVSSPEAYIPNLLRAMPYRALQLSINSILLQWLPEGMVRLWRTLSLVFHLCKFLLEYSLMQTLQ